MGFEDNKEGLGFEADQIDLDSDADLSMGTGRVRAQRKKGIKTEEVAFAKPKRDRFGRRSDGEESGTGADMLNPDKPTRIAGGFSRREMTPHEVKPLQSENSKFGYLFSEDEDDEDEVSTVRGKGAAVDALSMKGDEAEAGNIFERETRSVIHSQGKPQRRTEPAEPKVQSSSGRFSKRSEKSEQASNPTASRFSKRSSVREVPAEPVKEEPVLDVIPTMEEMNPPMQDTYTEPAAEETTAEQEATSAVYADNQTYGYGNPYMYGQYPPPYNPYGGYPPQSPYGQPYPQQPYPCQYPPAGYGQPQYIPVGYVFQAGFVPVEMAHNTPQRRRRPSAARAAHRYDEAPEGVYEERVQREAPRVRAIAARSEPVQESVQQPEPPVIPVINEEPVQTYETQYDRIAAEIPTEPVISEPVEEKRAEPVGGAVPSRFSRRSTSEQSDAVQNTVPSRFAPRGSADEIRRPAESSVPSRFARRGSSETGSDMTENNAPSRFSSRGAASYNAGSFEEDSFDGGFNSGSDNGFSAPASSGGRFKRRG